jgi:predicted HTH domain antitoxin
MDTHPTPTSSLTSPETSKRESILHVDEGPPTVKVRAEIIEAPIVREPIPKIETTEDIEKLREETKRNLMIAQYHVSRSLKKPEVIESLESGRGSLARTAEAISRSLAEMESIQSERRVDAKTARNKLTVLGMELSKRIESKDGKMTKEIRLRFLKELKNVNRKMIPKEVMDSWNENGDDLDENFGTAKAT